MKFSPVKTKAIQTGTCVRLLLQWGTHFGVSAESASRGIEDRTASVVLIMSSAWRKFTQRRTTARRSTTVAVDLPLFARIFLQLLVLDGVERLFEHDQAPSKCLPQQQVSGNLLFSPLALLCPVDGSFTIVCWGEHQRAPPLCFESRICHSLCIYIYIDRRVVTFL